MSRIFREFAVGRSARAIAADLNKECIPSPFGGAWGASTINGNLKRRSGFLYNEIYIGLLVFNRIKMVKDPETGKRISRPNPPETWQVMEVSHLRIVDDVMRYGKQPKLARGYMEVRNSIIADGRNICSQGSYGAAAVALPIP